MRRKRFWFASFSSGSTPAALRPPGADAQAQFANAPSPFPLCPLWMCFRASATVIPSTPIYTPTPYQSQEPAVRLRASLAAGCYNANMTLVEITYELQSPLTPDQLRRLGGISNTYGLPLFHFDPS